MKLWRDCGISCHWFIDFIHLIYCSIHLNEIEMNLVELKYFSLALSNYNLRLTNSEQRFVRYHSISSYVPVDDCNVLKGLITHSLCLLCAPLTIHKAS